MLDDRPIMHADEVPFGEESRFCVVEPSVPAYDAIPPGLDAMAPGPVLAGWLASIDVAKLSPFDRIVVLLAHDRMASHYQALRYRDMVAVADAARDERGDDTPLCDTDEAAAAEVAAALRLTRRGSDVEMGFALDLFRRLPGLAAMLESGAIDVARAKAIERATAHLSDAAAGDIVNGIVDVAGDLTTGELRVTIRRLCIEADPDDARDRYTAAVTERRVVAEATGSGTCNLLGLDLPPDRVQAITNRIDEIARRMRGGGETRSMDQLRADVFLDILTGTEHGVTRGGGVDIVVDLTTLAGLDDHPGDLAGYGPVIADVARRIAQDQADATWWVTFNDPDTGRPVAVGVTGRRPTEPQRRRIQVRDRTCVFPGCRVAATRSDLDHIIAVADGGPTTDDNLAPLCRYHHRIKHDHGWTYLRIDHGYRWTSPTGHTYTSIRGP